MKPDNEPVVFPNEAPYFDAVDLEANRAGMMSEKQQREFLRRTLFDAAACIGLITCMWILLRYVPPKDTLSIVLFLGIPLVIVGFAFSKNVRASRT